MLSHRKPLEWGSFEVSVPQGQITTTWNNGKQQKCVYIEQYTFYDLFICHDSTNSLKKLCGLENIVYVYKIH